MQLTSLEGVVERRLLVNYRVDADAAARVLPAPLRPQLVRGWAVAGICLLRLGSLHPRQVPIRWGLRSENAAHRIAVEWDTPTGVARGVYIGRRDTGSRLNAAAGGRIFPGEHGRAVFDVRETDSELRVAYASADGDTLVDVHARRPIGWPGSALFTDLDEASAFFQAGCDGYSITKEGLHLDGLRLRTEAWRVEPVEVVRARSSYFDRGPFPAGSATLDVALLMRDVPVRWQALPPMRLGTPTLVA
jgi:hypothetical protein